VSDEFVPTEDIEAVLAVDTVLALEQSLADAIVRSDAETASSILAEDFVLSSTGGMSQHMPRDEWLAALPQLETKSLEPEVLGGRLFGDVLVARLLVRWDASFGERDMTGTYAVTDVFRQEDGGWRLAWRISVRLSDE
jgi:ketosteroid isomerase-like protein